MEETARFWGIDYVPPVKQPSKSQEEATHENMEVHQKPKEEVELFDVQGGKRIRYRDNLEKVVFLKEVSERELWLYRLSEEPGFVLKEGEKLYYTPITKQTRPVVNMGRNLGTHRCSVCKRLTALSTMEGGCDKVKDLFLSHYNQNNFEGILDSSKRIEKYSFIKFGAEIFNFRDKDREYFLVFECEDTKPYVPNRT